MYCANSTLSSSTWTPASASCAWTTCEAASMLGYQDEAISSRAFKPLPGPQGGDAHLVVGQVAQLDLVKAVGVAAIVVLELAQAHHVLWLEFDQLVRPDPDRLGDDRVIALLLRLRVGMGQVEAVVGGERGDERGEGLGELDLQGALVDGLDVLLLHR